MGDLEGFRFVENPAGEPLLLGGDEGQRPWPAPMAPEFGKSDGHKDDRDHEQEHEYSPSKKSVLAKVKDKAKKWRQTFAKKIHGHSEGSSTPRSGVSLDDDDESEEQDPEYHGAPMYESETAPDAYKDVVSQHHQAILSPMTPTSSVRHLDTRAIQEPCNIARQSQVPHIVDTHQEQALHHLDAFKQTAVQQNSTTPVIDIGKQGDMGNDDKSSSDMKTLTETVTEMLTPAYNMVSDATHMIASKIQGPTARDEMGAKLMWDKGVSMKEYLMHKLEPGEDDKALSQVITEAISPRKASGGQGEERSVVEKVKGAVSSLLGKEMQTGLPTVQVSAKHHRGSAPLEVSTKPTPLEVSTKPQPRSVRVKVPTYTDEVSSPVPISTNPHAEVEVGERRLQAYTN